MAANDPARRLRVRIESLVNGREICPAFFNFNGDDFCERCGYTDDVHLMRDLLKESAAPSEGITALLERLGKRIDYLKVLAERDSGDWFDRLDELGDMADELAAALRPAGDSK